MGAIILEGEPRVRSRAALVELELDLGKLRATTYLVCAKSALASPRVRAVAELLRAELLDER